MGFASDHLQEMWAKAQLGEACQIDVPDGSGSKVWVKTGQERYVLSDGSGKELRIQWGETCPPKPIKVEIVDSTPIAYDVDAAATRGVNPLDLAIGLIQEAAAQIVKTGLDPRDANAAIGQLRNVAAQVRGFGGLPTFPSVPFR